MHAISQFEFCIFIFVATLSRRAIACSSKPARTTLAPVVTTPVTKKATPAFTYNDPSSWPGTCATGQSQSPINIVFTQLQQETIEPLVFHDYDVNGTIDGTNNGHTEMVKGFSAWTKQPSITGGGLGARYVLSQFHFHWDGKDNFGSEHTINGLHYPLELHFVHIREDLNDSSAGTVPGGIAVVTVFFQLANDSKALFDLDDLFAHSVDPNSDHEKEYYSPGDLLPDNISSFIRYNGSLTTPPCSEGVIWTILETPNYVTEEQVRFAMRYGIAASCKDRSNDAKVVAKSAD